jgi:hypothetical protein
VTHRDLRGWYLAFYDRNSLSSLLYHNM